MAYTTTPWKSFGQWNGFCFTVPDHATLKDTSGDDITISSDNLGENYLCTVDNFYNLAEVELELGISTTTKPEEYQQAYSYPKDLLPPNVGGTREEYTQKVTARYVVKNPYDGYDLKPQDRLAPDTTGVATSHTIGEDGLIRGLFLPSVNKNNYTSAYVTSGTSNGPTDPELSDLSADFYLPMTHQVYQDGTAYSMPGNTDKGGWFVVTNEPDVADWFASKAAYGAKESFTMNAEVRFDDEADADDYASTAQTKTMPWYIVPKNGFIFNVEWAYLYFKYYSYST